MNIRNILKKSAAAIGFDLVRTNNFVKYPPARRRKLLADLGVDLIFDVGGNTGQFAMGMRKSGYRGKIVSFEPMSDAFRVLEAQAAGDAQWQVVHCALGSEDTDAEINISGNSYSSSILDIKDAHVAADSSSAYVKKEAITVYRMDSVFDKYYTEGDTLFVKIDTQGYEKHVIEGAEASLRNISVLQMELSLVSLYENDVLLPEMMQLMYDRGFVPWSVEEEFHNPRTGQLLQVNGLFVRKALIEK